jgi:ubiquinone/menaquinone biosynthesis C-methylase UbiE
MGISEMTGRNYLMESEQEALRLDIKTESEVVKKHARWAGIKSGMRVADLGCGSGKTSYQLNQLVQPGGETFGLDFAQQRINYAQANYSNESLKFLCKDIRNSLDQIGMVDFIWVRFVLEYYQATSFDIVKHIYRILKPGGIICLIDLDYNCLSHFKMTPRLEKALHGIMRTLERKADFDPYVGRKLYSYLYELHCQNIDIHLDAHHLIFGELKETDAFNWVKKVEVAGKKSGYQFEGYEGGYLEFFEEFKKFFSDPGRFTYTPVICCRGCKPLK